MASRLYVRRFEPGSVRPEGEELVVRMGMCMLVVDV